MKKLIAIGMVLVLALSLGAGTVLADPGNGRGENGCKPSVDVEKEIWITCNTWLNWRITIENTSECPVEVQSVVDSVFYKVGPGPWTHIGDYSYDPSTIPPIPPGGERVLTYRMRVREAIRNLGATELRNLVVVRIVGRDKDFGDQVSIEGPPW